MGDKPTSEEAVEEEVVELETAELNVDGTEDRVEMPAPRNWSSGTFACHKNPSSCALSFCCPAMQFGFNQRVAFRESCLKWTMLWLSPFLLVWLLIVVLVPSTSQAELVLQEIDANFRRHSSALHSHHNAGHHTSPPPPLPVTAPSELSRLDAAMYALPLAMVAVGLIGCCRRRKLREKYHIGGSFLADFFCHCLFFSCSIAREAREIRVQVVEEAISTEGDDLDF